MPNMPDPRLIPSPNADARPDGVLPELIVIHAISLPPDRFGGPGVEQLFTNRLDPAGHPYYAQIHTLRVSAHYFIRRTGETLCFVPPEQRAWHAGVSSWRGRERCNDFSIGIELEGCDTLPFEAVQYEALAGLLADLCASVFRSRASPGIPTSHRGARRILAPGFRGGVCGVCWPMPGMVKWLAMVEPEGADADDDALMRWPFPVTSAAWLGVSGLFRKAARGLGLRRDSAEDVRAAALDDAIGIGLKGLWDPWV
jgi:AmpD protein